MENYDTLLEKYAGVAFEKQYSLSDLIGDGDWNIDMESGSISFGDRFSAPMQMLGTYSFDSGTWLWAWANEASKIPSGLLSDANALRELGQEHNIEFLTMDEYKMEPTDVHSLGLIASGIFGASAYYAGNYGSGIALVTLKDERIDNAEYNEQARILSVFPEIARIFTVNHKRTLQNYLEAKKYIVDPGSDGNKLSAGKGINTLNAEFDDKDRLITINGKIK